MTTRSVKIITIITTFIFTNPQKLTEMYFYYMPLYIYINHRRWQRLKSTRKIYDSSTFLHCELLINHRFRKLFYAHAEIKCYWMYSIYSAKSMYIIDSNHYATEFVEYLLLLIAYIFKLIIYVLLQKYYRFNSFFFSVHITHYWRYSFAW